MRERLVEESTEKAVLDVFYEPEPTEVRYKGDSETDFGKVPSFSKLKQASTHHAMGLTATLSSQRYDVPRIFPSLNRETLLATRLNNKQALSATTDFMRASTERVLGEYFDPNAWEQTMLHTVNSNYPLSMLRVARTIAREIGLDGSDPAVEYVAVKMFLDTEEEKRLKESKNPVTIVQLPPNQIQEYIKADAARKKEMLRQAQQQSGTDTTPQDEVKEKIKERVKIYIKAYNLDEKLPLLDALAQIPLMDPRVQEKRIKSVIRSHLEHDSSGKEITIFTRGPRIERFGPKTSSAISYVQGLPPGTVINAEELARATKISAHLARIALKILEDRGKVTIKRRQGAIILGEGINPDDGIKPQMKIAMTYVESLPPGTILIIGKIAKEAGVSHVTAGHAVKKLEDQGKVAIKKGPGGGILVLGEGIDPQKQFGVSPQIKAAMTYIETLTPGTVTTIEKVVNKTGVGEETVKKVMKELKNQGKISIIRGPHGGTLVLGENVELKHIVSPRKESAIKFVEDKISDGSYTPGTKLTKYTLSEATNVSVATASNALADLAARGTIISRHGVGSFIK